MRQDEYLKHLDRAFTQTPPELTISVEEAFRRGEEAMKQRHKIVTALSVAAAVAVLCAALALAAGTMLRPRRDDVVAARGKGERAPTYSPVPETTTQPEQELVFATKAGVYYHTDAHCMGMMNAMPITEANALADGKQPCPICVTGDARIGLKRIPTPTLQSEEWTATMSRTTPEPEEYGIEGDEVYSDDRATVYYATMKGAYYHEDSHCSGMKGALPWTFEAIWRENERVPLFGGERYTAKRPCPVCVEWESPVVNVYATPKGQYYHIIRDCSGMKNATAFYTAEAAEEQGKIPCPVCLPDEDNLCWATPGGRYYHMERECMGMKIARIYMETSAQRQGKEPCPVCWR